MDVERDILISILKLTGSGPIARELVALDANVSVQVVDELLQKFRDAELIKLQEKRIEASSNQRARIAIHAIKWAQRRWEIDVLGCREPLIVCVDCKHRSHGWRESAIRKAAGAQALRTKVLAEALPSLLKEIGLVQWRQATLIPVILSLVPGPSKFYNKVPIVPILQIQNFLNDLPVHITALSHFHAYFQT